MEISWLTIDKQWNRTWDCVLIEYHNNITRAKFQKNNTRLYVPVVTLSINDNIKFLANIKQGFKRKISWNKYRSGITPQQQKKKKKKSLDYLIDPAFRNINRLFVQKWW